MTNELVCDDTNTVQRSNPDAASVVKKEIRSETSPAMRLVPCVPPVAGTRMDKASFA